MLRAAITLFVLVTISYTWALTGTIIDNAGNPLANAVVRLVNLELSDTTDGSGTFHIPPTSIALGGINHQFHYREPFLSGSNIYFSSDKKENVRIRVFSLDGQLVQKIERTVTKGYNTIPLLHTNFTSANGLYVITFQTTTGKKVFKHLISGDQPLSSRSGPSALQLTPLSKNANRHGDKVLAKTMEAGTVIDTLIITKTIGDVVSSRKVLIKNYDDNINTYTPDEKQILIIDKSNDNDEDGLTNYEERFIYFTHAELYETDGDGIDDFAKIKDGLNPRVAIIPDISFEMINYPVITATYSEKIGNDSAKVISKGESYANTSAFSSQQQINASASIAVMASAEVKTGLIPKVTLKGQITETIGFGCSQTWGKSHSTTMNKTWNEASSFTKRHEINITGGTIKVDIEFTNNGSQDIIIENPLIRLTATGYQADYYSTLIGELSLDKTTGNNEIYLSSKAGDNKVTRQFSTGIDDPDILRKIALLSSGMMARLTNIQFRTSLGKIDTVMSNVYRRTAEVIIDPGYNSSDAMIKKRIATRTSYNECYTSHLDRYLPVTLHDILQTTGAFTEYDTTDDKNALIAINGLKNGTIATGRWGVVLQSSPDSLTVFSAFNGYDPKTISVGKADVITFIYCTDQDNDSLPDHLEAVLGTDPHNPDYDGDGISDGREYFGWSVNDSQATLWQTNPLLADTDGDGIIDSDDPNPLKKKLSSSTTVSRIDLVGSDGSTWFTDNIKPGFIGTVSFSSTNASLSLQTVDRLSYAVIQNSVQTDTLTLIQEDPPKYSTDVILNSPYDTLRIKVISEDDTTSTIFTLNVHVDREVLVLNENFNTYASGTTSLAAPLMVFWSGVPSETAISGSNAVSTPYCWKSVGGGNWVRADGCPITRKSRLRYEAKFMLTDPDKGALICFAYKIKSNESKTFAAAVLKEPKYVNTWHHVAGEVDCDANTVIIKIDTVVITKSNYENEEPENSFTHFTFGTLWDGSADDITVYFDDVKLWYTE